MKATQTSNDRLILRRATTYSRAVAYAIAALAFVFTSFVEIKVASAQARVDLEDLSVKGEILNDNRMRMSSRESTRIQDRIKYRKNFRPEIVDGVDVRVPASEQADEIEVK